MLCGRTSHGLTNQIAVRPYKLPRSNGCRRTEFTYHRKLHEVETLNNIISIQSIKLTA